MLSSTLQTSGARGVIIGSLALMGLAGSVCAQPGPAVGAVLPTLSVAFQPASPAALRAAAKTGNTDAITLFYNELQDQANNVAGSISKRHIISIDAGSAGEFPFFWRKSNDFNELTYKFLNRVVAPGPNGTPKLTNEPFTTAFLKAMDGLSYDWSQSDKIRLSDIQHEIEQLGQRVVDQYQEEFRPISEKEKEAARVDSDIDYVIEHIVKKKWSGRLDDPKIKPINLNKASLQDLADLLPEMPVSGGNTVLTAVRQYIRAQSPVRDLIQGKEDELYKLDAMRAALLHPSEDNGGSSSIDISGKKGWIPTFDITKPTSAIRNDMNTKNPITVQMSVSHIDSQYATMSVGGSVGIAVPLDFISFNASGGASYTMSDFHQHTSSLDISLTFEGWSWIPAQPLAFDVPTGKGWFGATQIREGVANRGANRTGLEMNPDISFDFEKGGDFGVLGGVLVGKSPTISITFHDVNVDSFSDAFEQHASFGINLFGMIPFGASGSESSYESNSVYDESSNSITVTFTAPEETNTNSTLDQRAFVIGAAVDYPGASEQN